MARIAYCQLKRDDQNDLVGVPLFYGVVQRGGPWKLGHKPHGSCGMCPQRLDNRSNFTLVTVVANPIVRVACPCNSVDVVRVLHSRFPVLVAATSRSPSYDAFGLDHGCRVWPPQSVHHDLLEECPRQDHMRENQQTQ